MGFSGSGYSSSCQTLLVVGSPQTALGDNGNSLRKSRGSWQMKVWLSRFKSSSGLNVGALIIRIGFWVLLIILIV